MSGKEGAPSEFLSRSALSVRGWSRKMVRDLLGPPDDYATNPHEPTWPPVHLFAAARVAAAEATPAFEVGRARVMDRRLQSARRRGVEG